MMLSTFSAFLEQNNLLALFLTIALGYLLGAVNIRGFSLGAGAVLFVGLAVGAFAPASTPPSLMGQLGLLLFLYGVGIAYGAQFFRGLTSKSGLKANLAALVGLLVATVVMLAAVQWMPGVGLHEALGAFSGAGTSTAALQAALVVAENKAPATGYSVAYPFGVAVPILMLGLYHAWRKPAIDRGGKAVITTHEVEVHAEDMLGLTLAEASAKIPRRVSIAALRRNHKTVAARPEEVLQEGDVLMLTGVDSKTLDEVADQFGITQHNRIAGARGDLDYIRLFVSNPKIANRRLADVQQEIPAQWEARILHLRRNDADMTPKPDRILEFGDRVGILAPRRHIQALKALFGDSVRSTGELNFIGIGLGAALGMAVGSIPLRLPLLGTFSLGFAGLLLVALFLGWRRRSGKIQWVMPVSANNVLRNFGLTLFLAQVGMSSGHTFVNTVTQSGLTYILLAVAIVAAMVLITMLVSMWLFKIPFDLAAGIVSGVTGNPAILAFSSRTTQTDKPDIGYAMIFPSMTVLKILIVQVIGALGWGG
ncbi:aspartate:alanine exchanger family transporter [Paralysiella testudinis]|uniref:aspartate:alanine exchanger family transporter n=1 Tax=Paralysiella testudinis TaxID=2809020 RepID=UPI00363926AE